MEEKAARHIEDRPIPEGMVRSGESVVASTTQAPQGHPQSVPHQNLSSPPVELDEPPPDSSPELDFKQKVIVLIGALLTLNEQVLAQMGHATDHHPLLKDAWAQLAALNTHVHTVEAAAASPRSAR